MPPQIGRFEYLGIDQRNPADARMGERLCDQSSQRSASDQGHAFATQRNRVRIETAAVYPNRICTFDGLYTHAPGMCCHPLPFTLSPLLVARVWRANSGWRIGRKF